MASRHPRSAGEPPAPSHLDSDQSRLVTIAIIALSITFITPYLQDYWSPTPSSPADVVSSAASKVLHDAQDVVKLDRQTTTGSIIPLDRDRDTTQERERPGLFKFTHQDYLVRDKDEQKRRRSPSGQVDDDEAQRAGRAERQQKKANNNNNAASRKRTQARRRSVLDEDEADQDQDDDATSLFSLDWLLSLGRWTLRLLHYLVLPLLYLLRLLGSLALRLYHALRLGLSHSLRPVAVGLAPLGYLLSGMVYIFYTAPMRVLSAVGREVYPLYIFLGVATTVGLTMGVCASLVLYVTAFIFIDRKAEEKQGEGRKVGQVEGYEVGGSEEEEEETEKRRARRGRRKREGKGKGRARDEPYTAAAVVAGHEFDDWPTLSLSREMEDEELMEMYQYQAATRYDSLPPGGGGGDRKWSYPVGATARTGYGQRTPRAGPSPTTSSQHSFYGKGVQGVGVR